MRKMKMRRSSSVSRPEAEKKGCNNDEDPKGKRQLYMLVRKIEVPNLSLGKEEKKDNGGRLGSDRKNSGGDPTSPESENPLTRK